MENNPDAKALTTTKMVAHTIRETLLKVCRHYQDPDLGKTYLSVARYYEQQVQAIPTPPEQAQQGHAKLHT